MAFEISKNIYTLKRHIFDDQNGCIRPLSHGADCGCDPLAQQGICPLVNAEQVDDRSMSAPLHSPLFLLQHPHLHRYPHQSPLYIQVCPYIRSPLAL